MPNPSSIAAQDEADAAAAVETQIEAIIHFVGSQRGPTKLAYWEMSEHGVFGRDAQHGLDYFWPWTSILELVFHEVAEQS